MEDMYIGGVPTVIRVDPYTPCKFNIAWVGRCDRRLGPGGQYCAEHANDRCWRCRGQATRSCGIASSLVCGVASCDAHPHEDEHRARRAWSP